MAKFSTEESGATWWPSFQLKKVAPPGGQISNLYKSSRLVAIFSTIASGVTWWQSKVMILAINDTYGDDVSNGDRGGEH